MKKTKFYTYDPFTNHVLQTYQHLDSDEIETQVSLAFRAYHDNKLKSVSTKALHLQKIAAALRGHASLLAEIITLETGKAIKSSFEEIEKSAKTYDYFSENLETLLSAQSVHSTYSKSVVVKDSIGPILAIMPWNFPVWQLTRFAAPSVGIGNPILLKHSEITAGTAKLITDIFNDIEPGLIFNMCIDHNQANSLIADSRIRGVTLTGSTAAGRAVAETAGKHLKKCVLELGGSDAYVIFKDADIKKAASLCAEARMVNNGQSCVAGKRFIVEKTVLTEFCTEFNLELKKYKFDDPKKLDTRVGTLSAKKFQKQLLDQCKSLEETGSAKKIFDLADPVNYDFSTPAAFFPARAYYVENTEPKFFNEEFFGPVALLTSFETESEALSIANKSVFGLGGAVFSSDTQRAESFARKMEAGFVAINDFVKSAPNLPFGGVKDSGFGRELGSYGFNEFCNIKTLGFR